MPDMMAIVSKAVFEREAGKSPTLGTKLGMDRYVSTNKNLESLSGGGRLYLVTVRPPNEDLWLVAILDRPKHDGEAWVGKKSPTPLTDISKLKKKLKFESGTGITAKKGALGMSLQTPRALTAADTALLDQAAGVTAPAAGTAAPSEEIEAADGESADGLLAAILADPDSDDARRIYADLLAQGNDPRGEFILLDIALDGPLSIRKRDQLSARRQELHAAHHKRWFPYAVSGMRTHHGFLQAVKGTLKQMKSAASKIFAAEPVTEVELTAIDEESAEALVAARWLPRVRRLILRGELGDEGFAQLVAAPGAANLRALNVTSNELSSSALADLGDGLPRATALVLTGNAIGDEGAEGLARWKHRAGLETLYVSGCELSGAGLKALLKAGLPRLEKLCVSDTDDAGDELSAAIAAHAAKLPALRYVELANTGLGEAAVRQLCKAKLPALRRIDVRRNFLEAELAGEDARIRI